MALLASDNLSTYTTGAALAGNNGGTGWSGAWTDNAGSGPTVNVPISGNSNKIASYTSNINSAIRGVTSNSSTGKVRLTCYVNKTSTSAMMFFWLIAGGNQYAWVFDGSGSNWSQYRYNGLNTAGQSNPFPNANQWYKASVTIDSTTSTNNIVFYADNVATATFSSTVSSISTLSFSSSVSGYGLGMIITDIQIDDMASAASTNSAFLAFM